MKHSLRLLLAPLLLLAPFVLAQEAEKAPAHARPQDDPPVWAKSFEDAAQRARGMRDGRVLVELRNASCPDCERMARIVYDTASFRAFTRDKVPVSVNRASPEGERLATRFGVRVLPAWLVVTPDLLLCGKQEGATNQSAWVERFVGQEKDWMEFRKKLEDEKKAPADPAVVFAAAEGAYRHYGEAMAEERFRRVAENAKAPSELCDRSLAYLASIALNANRFDDAEKSLSRLVATSKDPALVEKAELRLADVALGRGGRKKAAERLNAFLEKHPASPSRPQAEALLKAIEAAKP